MLETLKVRSGVIIVGPAAFGKTKIIEVVKKTINNLVNESDEDEFYKKVLSF